MKLRYQCMLLALLAGAMLWPAEVRAQEFTDCPDNEDVCFVEWSDGENVINNALRNTIANDDPRPEGRIYLLERGGLYYNEDRIENAGYHLRIIGQTAEEADPSTFVCGPNFDQDCGPAIIQMVTRSDGSVDQRMITGQDDITLKNLWITGQDDAGLTTAYTPIQIDASNMRFVADNIIWERSNFALVHFTGENNDAFFTNSHWRNFINTSQQWEGRGIQFSAGADSVVVENNTFFNIGMTVIQSEAQPLNYVRFNHNTMVNIGRAINSGGIWKEAYFTNNIVVNGFWHGEGFADINSPGRDTETAGLFSVAELPAEHGTNLGRRIVFANTATWRDPAFAAYYADSIRAQPLFNEVTAEFFADFENINAVDNLEGVNPELVTYPQLVQDGIIDAMVQNMMDLRAGITPATSWLWDPGRDPQCYQGVCFVYPLPEDFSYSNADLLDAGTDGLPLGDLNWFPDAKETFEANKEQFVAAIEAMAQAPQINVVANPEAETGTLEGDAEVQSVEGQTFYTLNPGSAIEWTFDIPEEKEYGLRFHVNMAGRGTSGLDMLVNGTQVFDARGWDQFVIPVEGYGGALNEWVELTYTVADMADRSNDPRFEAPAEVMTLPAGENTLRIQASWAENTQWSQVDVIDPATGDVVVSLMAPEATSDGSSPGCGEGVEFCANGFQYVALNGGSVSWNVDVPSAGNFLVRIFYGAPNGGSGDVLIDGETVTSVAFEADGSDVLTSEFAISDAGTKTVTLTASGEVNVDFIQLLSISRTGTSTDRNELPDGYALDQNYPNPFNPTTTINYTLKDPGSVSLVVYDLLGRKVMTLINGVQLAGQHRVTFDGRGLSSGVYFYRLETPVGQQVRSMVLMK